MLAGLRLRTIAPWAVSVLKGRTNDALPWWSRGGGDPGLPQASWRRMLVRSSSLSTTTTTSTAAGASVGSAAGGGTTDDSLSSSFHATSVPLGRIFNPAREYLFSAERNIRSFEWTSEEAEELLDTIDEHREGTDGVQLNTICLVRRELSDAERNRLGRQQRLFDVYDGQQRLVSLCLLFAAVRDHSAAPAVVAEEAAEVIYPRKGGQGEPRITMNDQDGNHVLLAILRKRNDKGLHKELKEFRKSTLLPAPAQCLLEVFDCFVTRLKDRSMDEVERLFNTLQEDVYLNVGIANAEQLALDLVMSQNKGKNIGNVDHFKALLCYLRMNDGATSLDLQKRWNSLCAEVDRDTVEDCCLLLAQIVTRKRLQKGGEINLVHGLFKQSIPIPFRNRNDFIESLEKAARLLRAFRRDARVEEIVAASATTRKCSVEFLRLASTKIRASKEIELVVFALLLRSDAGSDSWYGMMRCAERVALWMMLTKPVARKRAQRCMHILDVVADPKTAWFTHGASKPGGGARPNALALETAMEERREIAAAFDTYSFGSTSTTVLVAKAVLGRLNEYELVSARESTVRPTEFDKLNIEHILPKEYKKEDGWVLYWPDSAVADEWYPKLGNLALVGKKDNVKMSNSRYDKKKPTLGGSPYPLTQLAGRKEQWDLETVKQHHHDLIKLAAQVWDL
jgi:Protein of unknown function (DUF1524)/Protein of unknown function DUF262